MPKETVTWSAWASSLAFFLAGLFPLFTADAYGHLAQGRQIVALGRVPEVDLFSFWKATPQPWMNYEWAYDWLSWLLYDRFGASALVLSKCLALAALGYLLVLLADRLARGAALAAPLALMALFIALPVARFRFTARPQIIGLVFPAVLLMGIASIYEQPSSSRRKGWILAGLGLLQIAWVNSHGSHLLGVAVTLIFTVLSIRTHAFRWMLALLLVQAAATACTPFGISIATDAIAHLVQPEYRDLVVEWAAWSPKDPLRLLLAPMTAALWVLLAMRGVTRSSRFGLAYGVLCVLLCLMAFRSMRFVAHQLLFCAPFIAAGVSQMPGSERLRRALPVLVGLAAIAGLLWTTQMQPALGFGLGESRRGYPAASADVIERNVEGARILASIEDSWFLMFAAPSGRLLIDGRVPFYGPEMMQRVSGSFADPELLARQLGEYDLNTVVIDHTRSDHIAATEYLSGRADWVLAFIEDGHSLFVRRDASPQLEPFRILGAGYRTGRILDASVPDAALSAEIGRIGAQENTASIHAWHEGLALLRPLARDHGRTGTRIHRDPEEKAMARAAYERLGIPAASFPGFTSVELHRAMAALSACDVDEARIALGRARYGGETRETSLLGLELGLRAGDDVERSDAAAHLEQLQANPQSRIDPWVIAIAADSGVRCTPP